MLSSFSSVTGVAPLTRVSRSFCAARPAPVAAQRRNAVKLAAAAPFIKTHIEAPLAPKIRDAPKEVAFSSASGAGSTDQSEVSQVVLRGYQFVGLLALVRAIAAAAFAPQVVEKAVGAVMVGTADMLPRMVGIFAVLPVALLFCVQDKVADGQANADVTKRFAWSLVLSEIGMYAVKVAVRNTVTLTQATLAASAVFPVALLALYYTAHSAVPVLSFFDGMATGAKNTFKEQNWKAAFYALITLACVAGGIMSLVKPGQFYGLCFTGEIDALGTMFVRMMSPLFFLTSVVTYTLREAAEDKELGSNMSKILNLVLFAISGSLIGLLTLMYKSVLSNRGLILCGVEGVAALTVLYFVVAELS